MEPGEQNLVPLLMDNGFFDEILFRNKRVADNAWSLLHNVTNNLSECYNSVISKFVGGKRVNFSLKGGYTTRCNGANLWYNSEKGMYHETIQQKTARKILFVYKTSSS